MGFFVLLFWIPVRGTGCAACGVDDEGQDGVDDAEDGQPPDVKGIGTGTGDDRPTAKPALPPTEKDPMALPFWLPEMLLTMRAASGW